MRQATYPVYPAKYGSRQPEDVALELGRAAEGDEAAVRRLGAEHFGCDEGSTRLLVEFVPEADDGSWWLVTDTEAPEPTLTPFRR